MQALKSLTEQFKSYITGPAHLSVSVPKGQLLCTPSAAIDGFEIEYTANIKIQNTHVEPQQLLMSLVSWLNIYDCERESKGLAAPSFDVSAQEEQGCDITINLTLREAFCLELNPQGQWQQNGLSYSLKSQFQAAVTQEELDHLIYVVGHTRDFPCIQ